MTDYRQKFLDSCKKTTNVYNDGEYTHYETVYTKDGKFVYRAPVESIKNEQKKKQSKKAFKNEAKGRIKDLPTEKRNIKATVTKKGVFRQSYDRDQHVNKNDDDSIMSKVINLIDTRLHSDLADGIDAIFRSKDKQEVNSQFSNCDDHDRARLYQTLTNKMLDIHKTKSYETNDSITAMIKLASDVGFIHPEDMQPEVHMFDSIYEGKDADSLEIQELINDKLIQHSSYGSASPMFDVATALIDHNIFERNKKKSTFSEQDKVTTLFALQNTKTGFNKEDFNDIVQEQLDLLTKKDKGKAKLFRDLYMKEGGNKESRSHVLRTVLDHAIDRDLKMTPDEIKMANTLINGENDSNGAGTSGTFNQHYSFDDSGLRQCTNSRNPKKMQDFIINNNIDNNINKIDQIMNPEKIINDQVQSPGAGTALFLRRGMDALMGIDRKNMDNFMINKENDIFLTNMTNVKLDQLPSTVLDTMQKVYNSTNEYFANNPNQADRNGKFQSSPRKNLQRGTKYKLKDQGYYITGGTMSAASNVSGTNLFSGGLKHNKTSGIQPNKFPEIVLSKTGMEFYYSNDYTNYHKSLDCGYNENYKQLNITETYDAKKLVNDRRIFAVLDSGDIQAHYKKTLNSHFPTHEFEQIFNV